MVDFGQLIVAMEAPGLTKTLNKLETFQKQTKSMFKAVKPQMEQLSKRFEKFGAAAFLAFNRLIAASPRLRAQMEILNFRVNSLVRGFGDALAPAIKILSEGVAALTEWFKTLPEPMQEVIFFGGAVAVTIGLLTLAFIALNAAMTPITLVILGIAAAAAILYLVWTENLFGIQEIAEPVFEGLTKLFDSFMITIDVLLEAFNNLLTTLDPIFSVLESIVVGVLNQMVSQFTNLIEIVTDVTDLISAVVSGDWNAAMEALLSLVGNTIEAVINWFLKIPLTLLSIADELGIDVIGAITDFLDDFLGLFSDFVGLVANAAGDIVDAFIDGIVDGLLAGVKLIEDGIDAIAGLFGGSLPEWGPLKDALPGGEDMARKYFADMATQIINSKGLIESSLSDISIGFTEPIGFPGITPGLGGPTTTTENRTIIIEKIELVIPGATTDSAAGFLDRLDTRLRQATKF